VDWVDGLSEKVRIKCIRAIERLGHELRRPEAEYLRDGIHELRIRRGHVNYRLLYFFWRRAVVVMSHGLAKERRVPAKQIDLAVSRRELYEKNPVAHSADIDDKGTER